MEISALKLSDLLQNVKDAIKSNFPKSLWVIAEISEMSVNYAGHCFLELIEKQEQSEHISAKIRATAWASVYRMLAPYFETITGSSLEKGMKILIKVNADFNEIYGLSLNITDIDPNFTIGEQERLRREIIKQLDADGVMEMNSMQPLPTVIQRIAILSSETAAGYGDFIDQLTGNEYGYSFQFKLFPCIMQGQKTAESIIWNLEKIFEHERLFDVVVIVRGGGSKSDLAWFDNYDLAVNIAQFPLPVISGIGHERDTSIVDMVAHTHLKTPTAVAEWIVEHNADFEQTIIQQAQIFTNLVNDTIDANERLFHKIYNTLLPIVTEHSTRQQRLLTNICFAVQRSCERSIVSENYTLRNTISSLISKQQIQYAKQLQKIETITKESAYSTKIAIDRGLKSLSTTESIAFAMDPQRVLERGFSITTDSYGTVIRSSKELKKGQTIVNRFSDGNRESQIL